MKIMDKLQTDKLENILELKDLKKIKEEIIKLGYRYANKEDGFEYDILEMIEQEASYISDNHKDILKLNVKKQKRRMCYGLQT